MKKGQISHLDGNPSNNAFGNLAFLCFDHHDELDTVTSQSKGLTRSEIALFKKELSNRIRVENDRASKAHSTRTSRERLLDAIEGNPKLEEIARKFGTPVIPTDRELSSFGKWKLKFEWKWHSDLFGGGFSPNNRLIIRTHDEWHIYDANKNEMEASLWKDGEEDFDRRAAWLAAQGSLRAYARDSGNIAIWKLTLDENGVDGEDILLEGHAAKPIAAGFDVNSSRFVSVDADGVVIMWDWKLGEHLARAETIISGISNISFYPAENDFRVILNNRDGEFEILDLYKKVWLARSKMAIKGDGAMVWHGADPDYIIGSDEYGRREVISSESLEPIDQSQWFGIFTTNCVSDGQRVNAIKNACGQVWIFERATQDTGDYASIDIVPPDGGIVTAMALSPDGSFFASIIDKRTLQIWQSIPR